MHRAKQDDATEPPAAEAPAAEAQTASPGNRSYSPSADALPDHAESEGFFMRRRRWFFGVFALSFGFDLFDTLMKGSGRPSRTPRWRAFFARPLTACSMGDTAAIHPRYHALALAPSKAAA
ncbi:hypothetical protein VB636_00425, partial [Paracoccus sp. APAP_BH8]